MKKADISRETQQALAQSLKKFMAQKSFDKITVRELLEDCDVSRPTFYYHFEDVYALLKWTFETELVSLLEKSQNCISWEDGVLLAFRYVEQNRKVCLCAYNSVGRETLYRLFRESVSASINGFFENIQADIPAKAEDIAFLKEFYTTALVEELVQWLRFPNGRSPEDMMRLLDMTLHGNIRAAMLRSAEK